MSKNPILKRPFLAKDLVCYLRANPIEISLPIVTGADIGHHRAVLSSYQLPSGALNIVTLILYLPVQTSARAIESKRTTMVKAALAWHKLFLAQNTEDSNSHHLLTFDIQLYHEDDEQTALSIQNLERRSFEHSFGARYFLSKRLKP